MSSEFHPTCQSYFVHSQSSPRNPFIVISCITYQYFLVCCKICLDLPRSVYLNRLTYEPAHSQSRPESRRPTGLRSFAPPARSHSRRSLCQRRVLRSERSRAGALRDAPPALPRGISRNRRCAIFRGQSPSLLSDPSCLRGGRNPRAPASAARPQACTQVYRRATRLRRSLACRARLGKWRRSRRGRPTTFRNPRSSPIDRPSFGSAEKKTLASSETERVSTNKSADVLDHYEALRRQVLDCDVSHGTGLGMALFLTRGMSVWLAALRDLVTPSSNSSSNEPPADASKDVPINSELINAVAEMVLACSGEGTK